MDIADAQSVGIFAEVTDNMDGTLAGTLQITVGEDNAVNMTQIGCHAVGALTVERVFSGFVSLVTFGEFTEFRGLQSLQQALLRLASHTPS